MKNINVILIVIDTLRKDYAKHLEVELEKLGFLSYEKAVAPASWTAPSHASIFTGLYPINPCRRWKIMEPKNKTTIRPLMLQNKLGNMDTQTTFLPQILMLRHFSDTKISII